MGFSEAASLGLSLAAKVSGERRTGMQLLQELKLRKIGERRMRQRLGQLPRCPALTPDGLSGAQLRLFGAGSLPSTGP